MLTKQQIKMIQTAVRAAGLRSSEFEGRYRLLLGQYLQPNGEAVTSCKQLNHGQLEDMLAICEAYGWRMPGKEANHFRLKRANKENVASFAQQAAIEYLAGDLGWNELQLGGLLKRLTNGFAEAVVALSPGQAYNVIEALKSMIGRRAGKQYNNLKEVQADMEVNNAKTSEVG